MKNTYRIKIQDDDDLFDLYKNGEKITTALWISYLLIVVADYEGVDVTSAESESHMLAILKGDGVDVDAGSW